MTMVLPSRSSTPSNMLPDGALGDTVSMHTLCATLSTEKQYLRHGCRAQDMQVSNSLFRIIGLFAAVCASGCMCANPCQCQ